MTESDVAGRVGARSARRALRNVASVVLALFVCTWVAVLSLQSPDSPTMLLFVGILWFLGLALLSLGVAYVVQAVRERRRGA